VYDAIFNFAGVPSRISLTQSSHKIFNILDYDSETPHYEPQSPLKRDPRWHTSKIKDGIIHMDELSFDLFLSAMINRVSLLLGKMFVLVHLYSFTRPKKSK
jgi:hypothetical protein